MSHSMDGNSKAAVEIQNRPSVLFSRGHGLFLPILYASHFLASPWRSSKMLRGLLYPTGAARPGKWDPDCVSWPILLVLICSWTWDGHRAVSREFLGALVQSLPSLGV